MSKSFSFLRRLDRLPQPAASGEKWYTCRTLAQKAPKWGVRILAIGAATFSTLALLATAAGLSAQPAAAQLMKPDPSRWQLYIAHDFRNGDKPSIYRKYCGPFGGNDTTRSARSTNFSPQNVYWQNGALVFKFEVRRNQACTGHWADRAGGGIGINMAGQRSLAVEFDVAGNDVRGSHSYATTWPETGQTSSCDWGAEDDFYEQVGRAPRRIWSTSHNWTDSCEHKYVQTWYDIPDYANFHAYGVVRTSFSSSTDVVGGRLHGCIDFYVDGKWKRSSCDTYFRPYLMGVGAGIGGPPSDDVDYARLPTTFKIRKIKIWRRIG